MLMWSLFLIIFFLSDQLWNACCRSPVQTSERSSSFKLGDASKYNLRCDAGPWAIAQHRLRFSSWLRKMFFLAYCYFWYHGNTLFFLFPEATIWPFLSVCQDKERWQKGSVLDGLHIWAPLSWPQHNLKEHDLSCFSVGVFFPPASCQERQIVFLHDKITH